MAADERPELRKLLLEYCDRVPPSVNNGSHDLSVRFKAEVRSSRTLAKKPGATVGELRSAINLLHRYWT